MLVRVTREFLSRVRIINVEYIKIQKFKKIINLNNKTFFFNFIEHYY